MAKIPYNKRRFFKHKTIFRCPQPLFNVLWSTKLFVYKIFIGKCWFLSIYIWKIVRKHETHFEHVYTCTKLQMFKRRNHYHVNLSRSCCHVFSVCLHQKYAFHGMTHLKFKKWEDKIVLTDEKMNRKFVSVCLFSNLFLKFRLGPWILVNLKTFFLNGMIVVIQII